MIDKFHDECGLIGVWNHKEASNLAYLGLYAQQHRGQEGAGVVSVEPDSNSGMHIKRGMGLVGDVFLDYDFSKLPGRVAIGHVRYSTAGGNNLSNVQPFNAEISKGEIAIAHNGNLTNAEQLRADLIKSGSIFSATSDTEIILHLIARDNKSSSLIEAVSSAIRLLKGAFSLLILFKDRLFALRDPNGFRPLALASLNGSYIIASETCAFDLIGASYIRDIEPGEVVEINGDNKLKSYFPFKTQQSPAIAPTPCIFEYVYFARPDSHVFGRSVYRVRRQMGVELARESNIDADFIVPVPDSGVTAAIGYSAESKIPLELGLIRNHYVGRTFIEPKQSIRDFGVKIKHNANRELLNGKRIIVVDDSIVRGTTTKKLVKLLREAGAKEVHVRISAPPTTGSCFYGIDTPSKDQLIAANMSVDQIREFINADSLAYLSLPGLFKSVNSAPGTFCDACFSGNYPI